MPRTSIRQGLKYAGLWVIALLFFSPVLWIFLAAFKTSGQILARPPLWIFHPTLQGLVLMTRHGHFWHSLANSVFISLTSVILALVVSFLAAFSFSRFRPAGTNFLMFILLSIRMVPGAAVVIPIYLMYRTLGWTNTYFGIILFYTMFSIPFSVWILKGFLDGVSRRHDEATLVDGGSWFYVMFFVILPQVIPGIIAAFIFNMIFVWNEFLFDFMIGGEKVATIPVALANGLYTSRGIDWQYIASLSFVYAIPLVFAAYLFQRYLLVGMTFGTVRGDV